MSALCVLSAAAAFADAPRRAIVVPTQLGGFIPNRKEVQQALNVLVENRLRRVRIEVLPQSELSREEAQCQDDVCLERVADLHMVDVVVVSRFINDEQNVNAYHLGVKMFVRGEKPTLRSRQKECPYCSEDKATDLLATTVAEMLANAPEPQVVPPPTPERPSRKRAVIGFVMALAGGVGFVASTIGFAVKASQHGDPACDASFPADRRCPYQRDTTAGMAASGTVALVSLGVGIAGLVIALRRPPRTHAWWIVPAGAGARAGFSF